MSPCIAEHIRWIGTPWFGEQPNRVSTVLFSIQRPPKDSPKAVHEIVAIVPFHITGEMCNVGATVRVGGCCQLLSHAYYLYAKSCNDSVLDCLGRQLSRKLGPSHAILDSCGAYPEEQLQCYSLV